MDIEELAKMMGQMSHKLEELYHKVYILEDGVATCMAYMEDHKSEELSESI